MKRTNGTIARCLRLSGLGLTALVLIGSHRAAGVDLLQYGLAKGRLFQQTNTGAAVALPTNGVFFTTFVEAADSNAVTQASLIDPLGATNVLGPLSPLEFTFESFLDSQTNLDATYPTGTYTFVVGTLNDGDLMPTLDLPADAYPNAPHVSNWSAAQVINAPLNFTLSWDAFTNGTSSDFIELQIQDSLSNEVFRTADSFSGTNRSVLIPGGTFTTGQTYQASLLFEKNVFSDTNAAPGSTGLLAYQSETRFPMTAPVPTPVSFTNSVLPPGEIGSLYVAPLGISGGVAPYTFSILKGRLPRGVSIDASGDLIGVPNEIWTVQHPSKTKKFKFLVNVTDTFHATASQQFKLEVCKPLSLQTTSLPIAERSKAYKATLQAIRGKKPYTWSITSGNLPTGLNLNSATGRIEGTPTQPGGFPITIHITDGAGVSASRALTLVVN